MMTWILSSVSKRSSYYKLQVMNDMQRELDENVVTVCRVETYLFSVVRFSGVHA